MVLVLVGLIDVGTESSKPRGTEHADSRTSAELHKEVWKSSFVYTASRFSSSLISAQSWRRFHGLNDIGHGL